MNYFHDVLIVGAGGSGLSLAIKLKREGILNVGLISKTSVMGSHTSAAKGGINASLSSVAEDDPEWHVFDTLKSANEMAEEERVRFMCHQAPKEIDFLQEVGVNFDKLPNGKIDQRRYGGQKTHFGKGDFAFRACFSSDSTGFEIMKNLHNFATSEEIKIYDFHFAFDVKEKTLLALNLKTGEFSRFHFRFLVFAGGGFSQNYYTNSSSNALTGDCHILAMKLGGKLEDVEFVQFHPTGLFGKGILISEAVRAEGGILLNEKGERFMQKYSPDFLELAPRDIIARAIFNEGKGVKPCYLSLKNISKDVILTKLKGTVQTAKFFAGIDVFTEDIPVFPTAHYNMGGIKVDSNYKMKEGVFAIGECAGARIHGANRLGCNSLLELFTSSTLVCRQIVSDFHNQNQITNAEFDMSFLDRKEKITFEELFAIKTNVAKIMQEKCGVLREEQKMSQGMEELEGILNMLNAKSPLINGLVFSNSFVLYFEVINLIILSIETLKMAINRRESRGSHSRLDFPETSKLFTRI
jgi:succinate dehydrogenase/fumarate reductase flavoprotein subunit